MREFLSLIIELKINTKLGDNRLCTMLMKTLRGAPALSEFRVKKLLLNVLICSFL